MSDAEVKATIISLMSSWEKMLKGDRLAGIQGVIQSLLLLQYWLVGACEELSPETQTDVGRFMITPETLRYPLGSARSDALVLRESRIYLSSQDTELVSRWKALGCEVEEQPDIVEPR